MGLVSELGRKAWRKYVLDGVSSSGFNKADQDDIFDFVDETDRAIVGAAAGLVRALNLASLNAIPGARVGQPGEVTAGADKGAYSWSGSAWVKVGDLIDPAAVSAAQSEITAARQGEANLAANLTAMKAANTATQNEINTARSTDPSLAARLQALRDFRDSAAVTSFGRDAGPIWSIKDTVGRSILSFFKDGAVGISKLLMPVRKGNLRQAGSPYLWVVEDNNGRIAIWIDDKGRVGFVPAPELLSTIGATGYAPPSLLEGYNGFNARLVSGAVVASICDKDSRTFDVRQLVDSDSGAAVVENASPLILQLWYGQSNAGYGYGGTLVTGSLYPHHCLTFSAMASYGTNNEAPLLSADSLADFGPLNDDIYAATSNFAATTSAFAYERLCRDEGRATPGLVSWTAWNGGKAIDYFTSDGGYNNFANLMAGVSRAVIVAARYGRTIQCRDLVFVQGESGPSGRSTYLSALNVLVDQLIAGINARVTQTGSPRVLIYQINLRETETTANGVELAQLDAAKATPSKTWLIGPMYHLPFAPGDGIHQGREGRAMQGELAALVQKINRAGGSWAPVWPTNIVRSGANIDITFNVPARLDTTIDVGDQVADNIATLEFDDDWITASTPNYGFEYRDDAGVITVSSVTITSANTVRVTLSANPGTNTNKKIGYAMNGAAVNDGWANARGLLYADSGVQSPYHRLGYAVPPTIRHYAVRFEEDLS